MEMKWEFTSWGECPVRVFSERSVSAPAADEQFPDTLRHLNTALAGFLICDCYHGLQKNAASDLFFKVSQFDHHFENLDSILLSVPLVSKVCPSDIYRVWKSGSCLRVDTTLLGFEHMTWLKGRRSYIFKGEGATDADGVLFSSCSCRRS